MEDMISTFSFYAKAINSVTGDDVRISERLYMPSSKLRGFQRGKVGPVDGTDHIGGNYAAALNIEANLPNLLPEDSKTDVNVFLDFGIDQFQIL